MRARPTCLLVVALVVSVVPAVAAPEGPPKPAAEMANLKVFDGSWTCEGTANPSPMGAGGKLTSWVTSHTDLGGFWQSGTVKSSGAGMPGTMEGMFHMTYDPGSKRYVLLWVDNMGGWSQATSPGWEGDELVFTGESTMAGQKMQVRDRFVKAAAGSLRHDWEAQLDGKWAPLGSETCRKGAAAK